MAASAQAWSDPSLSGADLVRAAAVAQARADVWQADKLPCYLSRLADVRFTGEWLRPWRAGILPEVPSRERRGRPYGEIAAGHLQRRELDQARHFLERSYAESPEEAPYSPLTRGVAVELVRTATGSLKAEAVALVERMGVLPAA